MSRKTHVSHKDPFINPVYVNWLNLLCQLISPKDLYLLAGRGAAKTDIFAQRSMDVMYDMPGSQQVLVSDTYVNARNNISFIFQIVAKKPIIYIFKTMQVLRKLIYKNFFVSS